MTMNQQVPSDVASGGPSRGRWLWAIGAGGFAVVAVLVALVVGFLLWNPGKGDGYPVAVTNPAEAAALPDGVRSVRLIGVDDSTLLAMKSLSQIEYVLLSHPNGGSPGVTEKSAQLLAAMPRLRQVVTANVRTMDVPFMQALAASKSIDHLSIKGLPAVEAPAIESLKDLATLRILTLFQVMDAGGLDALARLRQIRELYFEVEKKDLGLTPRLAVIPNLERITIKVVSSEELTGESADQVRAAFKHCQLELKTVARSGCDR